MKEETPDPINSTPVSNPDSTPVSNPDSTPPQNSEKKVVSYNPEDDTLNGMFGI